MKKLFARKVLSAATVIAMLLAVAGCSSQSTTSSAGGTSSSGGAASSQDSSSGAAPSFDYSLTLYAGSMGGSYYTIATAMSEIFSSNIEGTTIGAASATAGDNIVMVESGEAEIAMAGAPDYVDVMGGHPKESEGIRTMGVFNQLASVIVVRADSDYHSIDDLVGQKIQVGAAGTGQCLFNLALLDAAGYSPDDFSIEYMSQGDASEAFVEGKLEACFVFASLPASAITQMTSAVDCRVIPLSDELMNSLVEKYPYYKIAEVTPEQVPDCGVEANYNTLTSFGELLVNADLDEDFVYTLSKVLYENYDNLIAAAPGAEVCTAENAVEFSSFTLHPGTVRYLEEIGLM